MLKAYVLLVEVRSIAIDIWRKVWVWRNRERSWSDDLKTVLTVIDL